MNLRELAQKDGLKPKQSGIRQWVFENADVELLAEIAELRESQYTWAQILGLLQRYRGCPRGDADRLRRAVLYLQ